MAISLVIETNPATPQPIVVNGDVHIRPHLGAIHFSSGTNITGTVFVCKDLPNKSSVVLDGNNHVIAGGIVGIICAQGGGGEA